MKCVKCDYTNPEDAHFCSGCGSSIGALECQNCNTENSPESNYCHACGQSLNPKAPTKGSLLSSNAERRILTVLFCDLVDSTVLVDSLDPELSRLIILDFQSITKNVIEKLGGRVLTYLGDGIVAMFIGSDSNAERAINAALQINQEIDQADCSFSQSKQKIEVRCGIATGLAVVGDDMLGHSQIRLETAIGLPLNLASRIQGLAEPGGVAISNSTYKMARGLFEFQDIGEHSLKGIKDSQQVWRVIAEKSISSRFVAHAAELTPMIGRTEILQKLISDWGKSEKSDAQAVIITGEAGVGKSRVTQEFTSILAIKSKYHRIEYQCSPYQSNTALYPVISRIKIAANFEIGESPQQQLDKLETLIRKTSINFEHDIPFFVDLLSLSDVGPWKSPEIDLEEKKELMFTTLIDNMISLSSIEPLFISVEDAHWIDPTSLELVSRMVDAIKGHPILFIITSRTGFNPEFLRNSHVTSIEVERLPRKDAQQLLNKITGNSKLPASLVDKIIQRADGIPLFIEELSKSMIESLPSEGLTGQSSIPNEIIMPETLQESLLSRLDHLPNESKSIAHLAAVIGRDFSYDLLEQVANYQNKNLFNALTPLLKAQLMVQHKAPPNAEFAFKHALLRDVAYETLLKSDLIKIHSRIAKVILLYYPETFNSSPELIARHFTEGTKYQKATQYWLYAGKKASKQFAMLEARSHLLEGLECLKQCPDNDKSKTARLELLISLGPILMALEGSGSMQTRTNYSEAVKLCDQLPASAIQFMALWGQWNVSMDYNRDQGLIWADKLEQLAEKLDCQDLKLQAHHCQWTTRFHSANHLDAHNHLVKGLELYDIKLHKSHAEIYGGHDPKVCGLSFLSSVDWFLGHYNEAEKSAVDSLVFAEELNHAGSKLHVLDLNLLLAQYQNNQPKIQKLTEELSTLCDKMDLPEYEVKLNCCKGVVLTNNGELEEGIALIKKGIQELTDIGTTEDIPVYTDYLSKALGQSGKADEAIQTINRLLESLESQKLRYWHAELFRRKSSLLLAMDETEEALKVLLKSIDIANKQNALSLELRSVLDLYHLNTKTGLYAEAKTDLKNVCDRFSKGQSSPELDEARQILK